MAPAKVGTHVRVLSPDHLRGRVGVVHELVGPIFDCVVRFDTRGYSRYLFLWSELDPVTP